MTNENNSPLILGKVDQSAESGVFLDFICSEKIILTFHLELIISINKMFCCYLLSEIVSKF